jgi:hypothetical protein
MASLTPPSPPNVEAYAQDYEKYYTHYSLYMMALDKYNEATSSMGKAPVLCLAPAELWNRFGVRPVLDMTEDTANSVPDFMKEHETIERTSSPSTTVGDTDQESLGKPLPTRSDYITTLATSAIKKGNNVSDAEMKVEIDKLSASLGSAHVTEPDGTPTLATVVHALSGIYTPEAISDLKSRRRLPRSMRSLVNLMEMSTRIKSSSSRALLRVKDVRAFRK